jgi:hypothetical protein
LNTRNTCGRFPVIPRLPGPGPWRASDAGPGIAATGGA